MAGQFHWGTSDVDELDLRCKRIVCDFFIQLSRTQEEITILHAEVDRLEARRSASRQYMTEQVRCIDLLLGTPVPERPLLGVPSGRHEIVHPSDGVLAGTGQMT